MVTYCFVVPIRNVPVLTKHFLERIAPFLDDEDASLILVSDADDSFTNRKLLKAAASKLPRTRAIFLSERVGYGAASNRGVQEAKADVIVFINSDTFPISDSPRLLVRRLIDEESVGIVQGLLIHPQTMLVQSCGHVFGQFYNRHALAGRRPEEPVIQQLSNRQALTAAFYAVRRSMFLAHGGFDEWYWNSHEGMEFALKLHLEGYRCVYEPRAVAYHVQGSARRSDAIDEKQQVARFWARWGEKIRPDVAALMLPQLPTGLARRYLRIDLGTNRSWADILAELPLTTEQIATHYSAEPNIVLEEAISPALARVRLPLLYLTNHFSQIAGNKLWMDTRRRAGDLILDCHGNVMATDDL